MTTYLTWLGNNVMLGNFDMPKPQLVGTGGPSHGRHRHFILPLTTIRSFELPFL